MGDRLGRRRAGGGSFYCQVVVRVIVLMRPYYKDNFCEIYHGDCRKVLPRLARGVAEAFITDPVWPGASVKLPGSEQAVELILFAARAARRLKARRIVYQVDVRTDPRTFSRVPGRFPFQRICLLEYARPAYRGRHLSGDAAYIFGDCPDVRPGAFILPGRTMACDSRDTRARNGHPTPRKLEHVRWLVGWWGGGIGA